MSGSNRFSVLNRVFPEEKKEPDEQKEEHKHFDPAKFAESEERFVPRPVYEESEDEKYSKTMLERYVGKFPFRQVIVGPSASGKTCLLTYLVTLFAYKERFFDKLVIFSTNVKSDPLWKKLKLDELSNVEVIIEADGTAERLSAIWKEVSDKAGDKRSEMDNVWFIFDDKAHDTAIMRSPTMAQIYMMGRHKGTSVTVTSQAYKSVAPTVRTNATSMVIFNPGNAGELKKIVDEKSPLTLSKADFSNMLAKLWTNAKVTKPYLMFLPEMPAEKCLLYKRDDESGPLPINAYEYAHIPTAKHLRENVLDMVVRSTIQYNDTWRGSPYPLSTGRAQGQRPFVDPETNQPTPYVLELGYAGSAVENSEEQATPPSHQADEGRGGGEPEPDPRPAKRGKFSSDLPGRDSTGP